MWCCEANGASFWSVSGPSLQEKANSLPGESMSAVDPRQTWTRLARSGNTASVFPRSPYNHLHRRRRRSFRRPLLFFPPHVTFSPSRTPPSAPRKWTRTTANLNRHNHPSRKNSHSPGAQCCTRTSHQSPLLPRPYRLRLGTRRDRRWWPRPMAHLLPHHHVLGTVFPAHLPGRSQG